MPHSSRSRLEATLAAGLGGVSKPTDHRNWLTGILRASAIPFAIVLLLVMTLAHVAHRHCPGTVKLAEALFCAPP